MFYLLSSMNDYLSVLNVFRYITFRAGGATLTSLAFMFLFGPMIIRKLKLRQDWCQPIRADGPQSHIENKQGTPTMGGVMILMAVVIAILLWANLKNPYVWCILVLTLSYGLIGFWDDYAKVVRRSPRGLSAGFKLLLEGVVALAGVCIIVSIGIEPTNTSVAVPMFKDLWIPLGFLFPIFGMLVIVGSGNAVNLTDGLDGLAIVPVMITAGAFGIIAYLSGNIIFSNYLQIPYVPGTGELTVVCGALIGAGLGFLWFNAPPAMIFMGDTGSLALGGALGAIAVATKHELVLGIVGGVFVLETVSVIVQVVSFKLTGKRVFRMAPLHHHFEQKGWAEPTIVVRFWIISAVLAMIGLATLKLR